MNLIAQGAKIEGFMVWVFFLSAYLKAGKKILTLVCSSDYKSQYEVAIKEIAAALADGSIKRKLHIVEGLEKAPEALPMLFTGENTGKL